MAVKYSTTYTSVNNEIYTLNLSIDSYAGAVLPIELIFENINIRCISENMFFATYKDQDAYISLLYRDDLDTDVKNETIKVQLTRDGAQVLNGVIDNKDISYLNEGDVSGYRLRVLSFFTTLSVVPYKKVYWRREMETFKDVFGYCLQQFIMNTELVTGNIYFDRRFLYALTRVAGNPTQSVYIDQFYADISRFSGARKDAENCRDVIQDLCAQYKMTPIWWGDSLYIVSVDDLSNYQTADTLTHYEVTSGTITLIGTTNLNNDISSSIDRISDYTGSIESYNRFEVLAKKKLRETLIKGGEFQDFDYTDGNEYPNGWTILGAGTFNSYIKPDGSQNLMFYRFGSPVQKEPLFTTARVLIDNLTTRYGSNMFKVNYDWIVSADQTLAPTTGSYVIDRTLVFYPKLDNGTISPTPYYYIFSSKEWRLTYTVGGDQRDSFSLDRTIVEDVSKSFEFLVDVPNTANMQSIPAGIAAFVGEGEYSYIADHFDENSGGVLNDWEGYYRSISMVLIADNTDTTGQLARSSSLPDTQASREYTIVSDEEVLYVSGNGDRVIRSEIETTGYYDVIPSNNPELVYNNFTQILAINGTTVIVAINEFSTLEDINTPITIEAYHLYKLQRVFSTDLKRKDITYTSTSEITPIKIIDGFIFGNFELNTQLNEVTGNMYEIKL